MESPEKSNPRIMINCGLYHNWIHLPMLFVHWKNKNRIETTKLMNLQAWGLGIVSTQSVQYNLYCNCTIFGEIKLLFIGDKKFTLKITNCHFVNSQISLRNVDICAKIRETKKICQLNSQTPENWMKSTTCKQLATIQ